MFVRIHLLRALYAIPWFKGRDRLIGWLTETFARRPTRLRSGLDMLLDPAEWAQQEILVRGNTEPATGELIRKLAVSGSCVLDVGAHVGCHTLEAAKSVGPGGRVVAFDPQPYNADRVGRHAVLNGLSNILTLCAAVGDRDDFIKLPMQSERDRSRLSLQNVGPGDESAFVEVPLRRLDTVLAAHGIAEIQLLKIDVEGYELEVLRGLGSRLNDCRHIILELLDASGTERNRLVVDLLAQAGFEFKDVVGNPWKWSMPLTENNLWATRR